MQTPALPQPFIWRRLHSLMGLWLTLFIMEHLLTNSLAAGDGEGFIRAVNALNDLPYLQVIEVIFLGLPIVIHIVWGVKYLRTAKLNALPYARNHAYNWQRITSWILLIGVLAHIGHMRFVERPERESKDAYLVKMERSASAERLGVTFRGDVAIAKDFGTAELLVLRETFKKPMMLGLYTLLVLTACYHAFNGLWTFLITWGVTLTERSQKIARCVTTLLMIVVSFLGLLAVWGT